MSLSMFNKIDAAPHHYKNNMSYEQAFAALKLINSANLTTSEMEDVKKWLGLYLPYLVNKATLKLTEIKIEALKKTMTKKTLETLESFMKFTDDMAESDDDDEKCSETSLFDEVMNPRTLDGNSIICADGNIRCKNLRTVSDQLSPIRMSPYNMSLVSKVLNHSAGRKQVFDAKDVISVLGVFTRFRDIGATLTKEWRESITESMTNVYADQYPNIHQLLHKGVKVKNLQDLVEELSLFDADLAKGAAVINVILTPVEFAAIVKKKYNNIDFII